MKVREDEWLIIQQLFKVDVELRREVIVDDVGRRNAISVPGTASLFLMLHMILSTGDALAYLIELIWWVGWLIKTVPFDQKRETCLLIFLADTAAEVD